jgi:hypothetical protein
MLSIYPLGGMIMTDITITTVQNSTAMHNLYTASKKTADTSSNIFPEQMTCQSKSIPTKNDNDINSAGSVSRGMTQVSEWPKEETLDPVFITYNSGLTGYDTIEYFYDMSGEEDNPTLYMRTKSGKEENFYKLDINSINPSTATKAELLGYYSYQEYKGEAVDMYQLMADMDMAEHNGAVSKNDNLKEAFLKYVDNWLTALQNVFDIQKAAGDSKGAAATLRLINDLEE